jgi:hypothetical protein
MPKAAPRDMPPPAKAYNLFLCLLLLFISVSLYVA